jgi:hypothetical protein
VVAAASLAVIVGTGFGVQAAVLGRPGRAPLLVIGVVSRLVAYRVSQAALTVDGKRLRAVCTQRWAGDERQAAVRIADGPVIVEVGTKLVNPSPLKDDEFELSGCPRALSRWLATQLNKGAPFEVKPTRFEGRRVYAIRFPSSPLKLKLYIPRRGGLPLALSVSGGGIRGTSRLRYGRGARAIGAAVGAAAS